MRSLSRLGLAACVALVTALTVAAMSFGVVSAVADPGDTPHARTAYAKEQSALKSALIKQIRSTKVPAIFGSEVFPSSVLEQIGKETGVKYVDKLRDDDLPGSPGEADHSYLGLMKFDFVTMVAGLGGDASKLAAFDPADVAPDHADYPQ